MLAMDSPSTGTRVVLKRSCNVMNYTPPSNSTTNSNMSRRSLGDLFLGLPFEIQTKIFVFTALSLTCLSSYSSPQPAVLSQVCRAWRAVAISAPHIWSSFAFDLPREANLSVSCRCQLVNRMQSWLTRSRHHPLDFTVSQQRSVRDRGEPELAEVLLSTLLSHSRRWRDVRISIWNDDLANALNEKGTRFPLLRSLTIDPTTSKTRFPFSFKSLEEFWSQLSTVHLVNYRQPPPIDQALQILSLAQNVKSFTANMLCDSISPQYGEVGIELRNLTHMHIIFQHVDGIPRPKAVFEDAMRNYLSFLASLSTSMLCSLVLEWDIECADNPCIQLGSVASDILLAFFRRTGLTLKELSFMYLPVDGEALLECLAHTPFLRNLQLKYSLADNEPTPVNDKFLGGLTLHDSDQQDNSTVSLPLLETIKLETYGPSLTTEQLVRFVRSRMERYNSRIRRLERLELLTQQPLYDQFPPELIDFRHRLDIFSGIIR